VKSLNKRVFSGAVTMVLLRFTIKFLGLISTLVLARLITPEDFGLVAIVMSIYALIEMLKAFGFDVVLIQKNNPSKEMYNTTWTIQLAFGAFAGCIMFLIAPSIAITFADNRLEALSQVIALLFVINGSVNIGIVNFRKELNFKREFIYMSLPKVFAVITTITMAILYKSYWALISGMLVSSLSQVILSYIFSKFRPKFCLSEAKELFSFSSWLLIGNLLSYANSRAKDLLVGKLLGTKFTGLISVADEIASLPTTEMVAAINRATYPGYAKVSHDNTELKKLFLNTLSFIAILGIPASVGISLAAPYLVPVVLGEQWLATIPLIQTLGIAYALISINTNAGYIFLAKGKPKTNALISLARAVILVFLMLILINSYGVIGLAIALLITATLMFPVYFIMLKKEIGVQLTEYLSVLWRPLIASMVMYGISYLIFFSENTPTDTINTYDSLISLFAIIFVGITVYLSSILILWGLAKKPLGVESMSISKIKSRLVK